MPNIREQRIDDNGIYIKFSNGREVSITKVDILAKYSLVVGSKTKKKSDTIQWIKDTLKGLGDDGMIDQSLITVDFDDITGKPTSLEFDSG